MNARFCTCLVVMLTMISTNDANMTAELQDNNENDALSLRQPNSEAISTETVESDPPPAREDHNFLCMDDVEGVVMELLDDIAIDSAAEAIEKMLSRRLLGFVAAWGSLIIEEALVSAIAPTGDVCVDSSDVNGLNNSRVLLGRNELPLENLDPPRRCPLDYSYLRGQLPLKEPKRTYYDSETLKEVKAATRSHTRPSSIASSRMTMRSKVRKKQDIAGAVELSGPQPGVPYSTEPQHPRTGRNYIVSPRKAMAVQQTEADTSQKEQDLNSNVAALQVNIDTDSRDQEIGESSRRSPSSSRVSARRRPHPPGSAQNGKATNTFVFGEKEDEIQMEYLVLRTSPQRISSSSKNILPSIENGRTKPRSNVPFPASGASSNINESLNIEEPLEQNFQTMPLSPGVKVRVGEDSNNGPDLPHFASQMRLSAFARMETYTLPAQISHPMASHHSSPVHEINQLKMQQLGKDPFLAETAWEYPATDRNSTGDHDRTQHHQADSWGKSDYVSSTELTASCSCDSTSSLTLFRRSTKVERPCRSCNKADIESTADTSSYTNLVKQRAFHVKPTCLPSSPAKRAPGVSPRPATNSAGTTKSPPWQEVSKQ